MAQVLRLARRRSIRTVSVTGGEPLTQPLFLKDFLRELKKRKFRTYLETAGIHPDALRTVVGYVDVVSMDMKLPSATGKGYWKEHAAFLKTGGKKVFVKIVLEMKSKQAEIKKALKILSPARPAPLLVLQPVTPIPGQVKGPSADQVADAYALASRALPRVLVIPQQHKLWEAR